MPPRTSDEQLDFARRLRRTMTLAESTLWRSLRDRGIGAKFRRQMPIGPYVADFACVAARLVVELDGRPHDGAERRVRDAERDAWLRACGWTVLRLSNDLVLGGGNIVLEQITRMLRCVPSCDPVSVPSSDPASPGHLLPRAGEG